MLVLQEEKKGLLVRLRACARANSAGPICVIKTDQNPHQICETMVAAALCPAAGSSYNSSIRSNGPRLPHRAQLRRADGTASAQRRSESDRPVQGSYESILEDEMRRAADLMPVAVPPAPPLTNPSRTPWYGRGRCLPALVSLSLSRRPSGDVITSRARERLLGRCRCGLSRPGARLERSAVLLSSDWA